jgi:tetraacyldisaccharide 4'-kinase
MKKPKFWNKKNNLLSLFLLPVSFFIQVLVIVRNCFIKKEKFLLPIICVGNIYLGGTGKTPLSIKIVQILKELNKKAAIIRKFYKEHIDEVKLIESNEIKLFKNSTRALAIREAEVNKYECVVLDDGFQDASISKNLNIICFNENQLIGNGRTIPSGPLRESLSSLKKCQIVFINGNRQVDFEKQIKSISKDIDIFYSNYLPINIEDFNNQNLLAFAGIGNPENFFNLLKKNNLTIIKEVPFPDHYNYSLNELEKLIQFSLKNNLKIITTEKDFLRIEHYNLPHIHHLKVKIEIKNQKAFKENIMKYL